MKRDGKSPYPRVDERECNEADVGRAIPAIDLGTARDMDFQNIRVDREVQHYEKSPLRCQKGRFQLQVRITLCITRGPGWRGPGGD